jgi:ribonuclease-3
MTQRTRESSAEGGSLAPPDPRADAPRCGETPRGPHDPRRDAELEAALGYTFVRQELLDLALTHSSKANESGAPHGCNERLEFLGDAVLDLLISEWLMELCPNDREGWLSKARATAVNRTALAVRARALDLARHVRLGRGEERGGGRGKESILANVFEALIGAMYLDGGLEPARALVRREFPGGIWTSQVDDFDAKTRLQELIQRDGAESPEYVLTDTRGPDHARLFSVEVRLGGAVCGRGHGSSKREAEQAAARDALTALAP